MHAFVFVAMLTICSVCSVQAASLLKVFGSRYASTAPTRALCVYTQAPMAIAKSGATSDTPCEAERLFNAVDRIKWACKVLKLDAVGSLQSPSNQVIVMERLFDDEPLPLIFAFKALNLLAANMERVIPDIQNVHPLELEIAEFNAKRVTIGCIMSALLNDPLWPVQYAQAATCKRLQESN